MHLLLSRLGIILYLLVALTACAQAPIVTPVPVRPTSQPPTAPPLAPTPSVLPPATALSAINAAATVTTAPTALRLAVPTEPAPAVASLRAESTTLQGQQPIRVDIALEGLVDLYGVEFHLAFDADLMQVVDADPAMPGVQITPADVFADSGFVALNRVDNDRGSIDFAATLVRPAPPLSGRVDAASMALVAVGPGEAQLQVAQALLANTQGKPIPVTTEALTMDVEP